MSYQLRFDQSLGENLRRILSKQIEGALAVANGEREPNDTAVHAMRKHLKKARAVLQLLRREIGDDSFRRQDHRLRDVGRLTTEIRDAEVRLQTIRQIENAIHRRHNPSYRRIENLLAFELEIFVVALGEWEKRATLLLDEARQAINEWSIDDYGRKQLRRALQFTYKCCRKAFRAVQAKPTTANFHELRKQVKRLGYQVRLLGPLNQIVIGPLSNELTDLGHLLGRVHDLTFLADRLRPERGEPNWRKQDDELLDAIENSQAELQRDAAELTERFFAERPSEFGRLIKEWFKDAQHAESVSIARELAST